MALVMAHVTDDSAKAVYEAERRRAIRVAPWQAMEPDERERAFGLALQKKVGPKTPEPAPEPQSKRADIPVNTEEAPKARTLTPAQKRREAWELMKEERGY